MLGRLITSIENLVFNRVSIFRTIYFNYHYLPFKQALRLPIYLHRPRFQRDWGGGTFRLHGKVIIDSPEIKRGMIRLGFIQATTHPDTGLLWSNEGTVIFKGSCRIAQGSAFRNGGGTLIIGQNFSANPNTRFLCYKSIEIGDDVVGSWDVTISDYDYHAMIDSESGQKRSPYGAIKIGDNNWIGQNVIILKNTNTPRFTTIAAGSVVSGEYRCKEKSILKGNPAVVVAEGKRYMDIHNCDFDKR